MQRSLNGLIEQLESERTLSQVEFVYLLNNYQPKTAEYLFAKARKARERVYGSQVFIRGLLEISNFCQNDCLYCGIRQSNQQVVRYTLDKETILTCCRQGYQTGFRTFVLQSGENPAAFTDLVLTEIIQTLKAEFPDSAITLSLGERSRESYQKLFEAGADRYLLRHETANPQHYAHLHPEKMSWFNRINCLQDLKEIGYQVGCGFMVGSPGQTVQHLAEDLRFIANFKPHMVGIGPFIPHTDTPFAAEKAGSLGLTLFLLGLIRLIQPDVLLPSTTALATIDPEGRKLGMLAGANVIMPNISPAKARKNYTLYNNKAEEPSEKLVLLKNEMQSIGLKIVIDRGDFCPEK